MFEGLVCLGFFFQFQVPYLGITCHQFLNETQLVTDAVKLHSTSTQKRVLRILKTAVSLH